MVCFNIQNKLPFNRRVYTVNENFLPCEKLQNAAESSFIASINGALRGQYSLLPLNQLLQLPLNIACHLHACRLAMFGWEPVKLLTHDLIFVVKVMMDNSNYYYAR